MYKYLDKVNSPEDLKSLNIDEINLLANDIRKFLVKSLSKTGGHLSANLGVVELTLALHKVFDSPNDKIIWDVGHQSYVHKILTGRKEGFETLRQFKGMSGFPKEAESEHDIFDTGHSSTSISVASGLSCAKDIKNTKEKIVAVIGDGSITGGMALEAINHLGYIKKDMIIILNDNEMSIDKNVGGMATHLSSIIRSSRINKVKDDVKKILKKSKSGELAYKTVHKVKGSIVSNFLPQECDLFESLGIRYYGPIDGHNLKDLIDYLEFTKTRKGPILLHVITKKGRGYKFAENEPDKYHGVPKFDIKCGIKEKTSKTISTFVGEKLVDMARKDKDVVAITAAMPSGTGLSIFEKSYPNRYYDVGIAEQHATTFSAGLAKGGMKPYFVVYSSFLQRAYDQLIHDICITKKNVTFLIDRGGLVGNDGETHHGVFDLSYLNSIPNITVMAPKDIKELEIMMDFSLNYEEPLAIRYPRGDVYYLEKGEYKDMEIGKYEIISKGEKVLIIAIGLMVKHSLDAKEILLKENINPTIINARFLKHIDKNLLDNIIDDYDYIVTIEDNVITGGFGSRINKFVIDNDYNIKVRNLGIDDEFIEQGNVDDLYDLVGLSPEKIAEFIKKL